LNHAFNDHGKKIRRLIAEAASQSSVLLDHCLSSSNHARGFEMRTGKIIQLNWLDRDWSWIDEADACM